MQPLTFASWRVSPQFSQKSVAMSADLRSGDRVLGCETGLSTAAYCNSTDADQEQRLIVDLGPVRSGRGDDPLGELRERERRAVGHQPLHRLDAELAVLRVEHLGQ